jgi:hypothetical protein
MRLYTRKATATNTTNKVKVTKLYQVAPPELAEDVAAVLANAPPA